MQDLGADAVAGRKQRTVALPRAMIRNCRKAMFRWKIADSTGVELTGGKLLAAHARHAPAAAAPRARRR